MHASRRCNRGLRAPRWCSNLSTSTDSSKRSGKIVQVEQAVGEGSANRTRTLYRVPAEGGPLQQVSTTAAPRGRAADAVRGLVATILPAGYPDSVRPGYARYVRWQLSSMVCTSAAGVLSTQALLHAVGLGAGAVPLAAALNWVVKDGLGQLGGIAFSALVNTRFDANPKMWRMVAAVSLDCSTALELLAPLFPAHFLPLAAIANAGKNVSFLAATASRAAIHNAFAARENLADVTGKAGAQNILSSMGGMGLGIALSAYLGADYATIAPAAAALMCGHLFSTYRSLGSVVLTTIDAQRLEIIVAAAADSSSGGGGGGDSDNSGVPDPVSVSKTEFIFRHLIRDSLGGGRRPGLVLGASVEEALGTGASGSNANAQHAARDLRTLRDHAAQHGDAYVVAVRGTRRDGGGSGSGSSISSPQQTAASSQQTGAPEASYGGGGGACVYLLLMEHCDSDSVLRGALHAHRARALLAARGYGALRRRGRAAAAAAAGGTVLLPEVAEASRPRRAGDVVAQVRAAGWKTDVLFFEDPRHVRVRFQ
ncbi:vitamin B6 photo-protection and homoeostasis-domain-containing protein [Tribonema minus]|uniref:Vitamin B6 photo-protection and homoeostasis-domain-containing protein n=1 Tax=Tribonema minus TaxID=303371 RepID=A0A835YMG5_9STRA|nr:vitamin B6 photo-protection and homoeostasis-domain-containing protein [Tribonema minus]